MPVSLREACQLHGVNSPLAVLHLGDVALRLPKAFRYLGLGEPSRLPGFPEAGQHVLISGIVDRHHESLYPIMGYPNFGYIFRLCYARCMSENEPELELEIGLDVDDDGTAYMTYTCPECDRDNRVPARGLRPGSQVVCPCGETTIDLKGDSLDSIQALLDELGSLGNTTIEFKF